MLSSFLEEFGLYILGKFTISSGVVRKAWAILASIWYYLDGLEFEEPRALSKPGPIIGSA
jgi:hypothetical protein